jgi:hypothetical protein
MKLFIFASMPLILLSVFGRAKNMDFVYAFQVVKQDANIITVVLLNNYLV